MSAACATAATKKLGMKRETAQNTLVNFSYIGFVEEDDVIPVDKKNNLIKKIKQTFYFVIQGLELYSSPKTREAVQKLMIDLFDILIELCGVYPSMTPVVSRAITTPIAFGKGPVKLYHDPATFVSPTRQT